MSGPIDMGLHITANAVRFAWYYGLNRLIDAETRRAGQHPAYRPRRPTPSQRELLTELGQLVMVDADAVRRGIYPPMESEPGALPTHLARLRAMFADLPAALARRATENAASVQSVSVAADVPDYYAQDFHYQTGGYLTEQSASIYDVQVETLFYGSADIMRRHALASISAELAGRDQRRSTLLDIACGTGRLLRQLRLAWPALNLTGLDLSQAYLDETARYLAPLRPARLIAGNAESIPLPSASQDIVTAVFLYHELPPDIRRRVTAEIARVLKPGGLFVFVDSIQMGDRPGWDGLLEAFPVRFHEPYFRHYAIDDLETMFSDAGLAAQTSELAFLSKVMVRRKSGSALPRPDGEREAQTAARDAIIDDRSKHQRS